MEEIDYTKYGWVPPPKETKSASSDEIDYAKYGWVPPAEAEGLASASLMAAPRIAKDIGQAGINFLQKIPYYMQRGSTEIPGLADTLMRHPGHLGKQGAAGLAEMAQGLINTPASIVDYAADRLHLLPESLKKTVMRMPDLTREINDVYGVPQYPGEELARGIGRNLPSIGLAGKVAKVLNPMQLTSGSIAKNILKVEKENIAKYSGETGKYETLSNKAKSRGITGENIEPSQKDISILKKDMPEDEFVAIDKLLNDKNLKNAQNAISQLGHRERKLIGKANRGDILSDPEKDLLRAVKDTKAHIQENMFKDKSGKIHEDLVNEHKAIQKGYRREVIPYTKNKAIQEYKSGERLPSQLVKSLMSGKFPAQRGASHKALMLRRFGAEHPYLTGGGISGLGALLYKRLLGEDHES